jgi:transposase
MKKVYVVQLSETEQSDLTRLTMQGKAAVRKVKRAHILLQAHAGRSDEAIAERVGVSVPTVGRVRRAYASGGVSAALQEKPRSGRPPGISGETRAKVTALACSTPPDGRSRWTLRLLADKVVELVEDETCSYQSVRTILKKTNCSLI